MFFFHPIYFKNKRRLNIEKKKQKLNNVFDNHIILFMRYRKEELSALDKIYFATEKLIKEKDYNIINNSEIIREAEISRSTFYIYFKNKDQIVTHLCDDIFNHIFS